MGYQVLARKYRPQTFEDVVGQDHVVKTLSNAIETGRIAHAFLFVGPRGIGKTSTARILAKALNSPGGPNAKFNPDDEICREIAEGRNMDVLEIDGASNNNVDQIRELRDNVQYAPTQGNFKIYIIDEVHMLSTAAFNALLKTLEEPPAHVKFIFATTEPHKVLPTILSRCQRFDLKRISDLDIAKQLGFIAKEEGIEVSDQALKILARNAEGGMRDAESAFDQLISFCGKKIEEKDVLEIFGLTGPREIWDLAGAIQAGEGEEALRQIRSLVDRGKDLSRLTQELLRFFRNLLVFVISPQIAEEEIDSTELQHFNSMQPLPSQALILAFIDELVRVEEKIRYALVKEVLFEIAILRMTQQKQKVSLEMILKKVSTGSVDLEGVTAIPDLSMEGSPVSEPTHTSTPKLEPQVQASPEASPPAVEREERKEREERGEGNVGNPVDVWNQMVGQLKKKERLLARALDCCSFDRFQGGVLSIKMVAARGLYESLMKPASLQLVERAAREAFSPSTRLEVQFIERQEEAPSHGDEREERRERGPEARSAEPREQREQRNQGGDQRKRNPVEQSREEQPTPPAQSVDKAEFENDPLIREALKSFEARIVGVK